MDEESVSSIESQCAEVPDINALLISDHIILTEDNEKNDSDDGQKKTAPEKQPNEVPKQNERENERGTERQRRQGPNLLSKSMFLKLRRRETIIRDPLKDMRQYARRKESAVGSKKDNKYDNKDANNRGKTVVWINIQDTDGDIGFGEMSGLENGLKRKSYASYLGDPSMPTTPRDFTSAQWERAVQRVNLAYEHVQQVANRDRESQLAGIPTNAFQLMQPQGPQLKVITEIKASILNRRRRMKAQGLKSPPEESAPKKPANLDIPRGFVFPKEENFIRDTTKIEKIGVGWQLNPPDGNHGNVKTPPESCASSQSSYVPFKVPKFPPAPGIGPRSNSTIPGRLCRAAFPVTDALHRHGTSVTKLKGKTLRHGEVNVAKVWPRKLEVGNHRPLVNPAQMAFEDVPGGEGFILKVAMENRYSQQSQ